MKGRRQHQFSAVIGAPMLVAIVLVAIVVLIIGSQSADARQTDCTGWNPPNTLVLSAGSPQQGQVGKPFQTDLQVQLANTDGCQLTGYWAGVSVVFTAPSSGASGSFSSTGSNVVDIGTDIQGAANAPTFTANGIPGDYTIEATSSYGIVLLYLTNTANGVAASMTSRNGSSRSATVDTSFAQPLQVQVLDANGRPVSGASIEFALGTGATGASAAFVDGGAHATEVTDSNGIASSPGLRANGTPGRFTATASTNRIDAVHYDLRNLAPRLTAGAKTETATVEQRYRQPLRTRVLDGHVRPVEGVTVSFALAQGTNGASASFAGGATQATVTSDAEGNAISPRLVANSTAGSFAATATTSGTGVIDYSLRNLAGPPAMVTAGAASGESTPSATRFPVPLAVTVSDRYGNPIVGRSVKFSAPMHGPSGYFAVVHKRGQNGHRLIRYTARSVTVKTNTNGIAVAPPFNANRTAGAYLVKATLKSSSARAAFALVNTRRP